MINKNKKCFYFNYTLPENDGKLATETKNASILREVSCQIDCKRLCCVLKWAQA